MPGRYDNALFGPPGRLGHFAQGTGLLNTPPADYPFTISGVARDNQGNPIGGMTCMLFQTATDKLQAKMISEATTGVFSFRVPNSTTNYYIVFLTAAGDQGGTTVNTLTGS